MSAVLVIAVPEENAGSFAATLDRLARFDWRNRGEIFIVELQKGSTPKENASHLCQWVQANSLLGAPSVLVPDRVQVDDRLLKEAGYSIIKGTSISNLIHGDGLHKELQIRKLDWRSSVIAMTSRYALASITEKDINDWLRQFQVLGNHFEVGQHLLQLFEVLASSELADSLCKDVGFHGKNLIFGFNKDKYGKSWGAMTTLVKKNCSTSTLLPSNEAIDHCNHFGPVCLIEDGLFSGKEACSILDSLRGVRPKEKTQKVPALEDPNKLSKIQVHLRYGAICDFGFENVKKYLEENKLANIQIDLGYAVRKFKVLDESINEKLEDGDKQDTKSSFIESLRRRVRPYAFQSEQGWKDGALEEKAKTFCTEIGRQLWSLYIRGKGFDEARWPDWRVQLCALGMEGLGLTFAFPHSVPKATLPLFWAEGRVTFGGKTQMWRPLFQSANT